jgi:hypothetical protein
MKTTIPVLLSLFFPLFPVHEALAQVFMDRAPLQLEYRIYFNQGKVPIGSAEVSFEPKMTDKGKRLEVRTREVYTLPGSTPFHIEENVVLICDGKGVESFDATVVGGDSQRRHEAARIGVDYSVTSRLGDRTVEKSITAGVQNTIQGLYCGAYFAKDLRNGPIFEDFPLLFPGVADHRAGQLVREGKFPFATANSIGVPSYHFWVKRLDMKTDKFWLSDDRDQILLRKEQVMDRGTLVYEVAKKNGEVYPPTAAAK